MSTVSKLAMALALLMVFGAGAASAYDYCNPCARPVVKRTNCPPPAPIVRAPVVTTVAAPCTTNACGSSYSSSYSSSYTTSAPAVTSYSSAQSYQVYPSSATVRVNPILRPGEEVPHVPGL